MYADEGITGTREDKRDEFQRLMQDCRRGEIDRIYTKSISRFARNTKECLKNVRELKSLGITLLFEKENIDTANMTDEMMITIMGGLAQEESVSISQNIKWAYQKQMHDGTICPHSAPYGYRIADGKLVVEPKEAAIVQRIFNLFLKGYGYSAICQELNRDFTSKNERSSLWRISAIQYILTNEKYIGDSLWQKSYNVSLPFQKRRNKGEKEQFYLTNTHEPIICRNDFEAVQKIISERSCYFTPADQTHTLSKRIYCQNCGSSFKRQVRISEIYWGCRKHYESASLCEMHRISEIKIHEAFIRLYNKLSANYQDILLPLQSALQELKLKKYTGNLQIMDIRKEIAKLREQQHVLTRLKTKGFLDEAKFQSQTAELNTKISRLQRELKRLTQSDDEDETLDQIEMLTDFFAKRQDLMVYFEPEAFESIVEKIVVHSRNELEFHLIGGLKLTERI